PCPTRVLRGAAHAGGGEALRQRALGHRSGRQCPDRSELRRSRRALHRQRPPHDYSAVGQTTHVASRMEQLAAPGTTLMAQATAALVEGYVRVRSLGARAIKGLAEPLELFELFGAEPVRSRLQARAEHLTKFVGRA